MTVDEVNYLYHNDWIIRVWTIQEQALATKTTVMCGDVRAEWEH
jgi:hypothetical protein